MELCWSYEDDFIILNENLTQEEKFEMLKEKSGHGGLTARINKLKREGKTIEGLKEEMQCIIDIHPDFTARDRSKFMGITHYYLVQRVIDLNGQGKLRENPILTDSDKSYIEGNLDKRPTEIAKELDIPLNLAKLAKTAIERKIKPIVEEEKINISEKMPRKMLLKVENRPPFALDKKEIGRKKYKVGKLYEITQIGKDFNFKGKLISQTEEFILMEHLKHGYKESFKKVDFETGEYQISEVTK